LIFLKIEFLKPCGKGAYTGSFVAMGSILGDGMPVLWRR
jgi:hypothetical protein